MTGELTTEELLRHIATAKVKIAEMQALVDAGAIPADDWLLRAMQDKLDRNEREFRHRVHMTARRKGLPL